MDANEIESLLWDCVNGGNDPDHRDYQSSGVTKLAELLAAQERRIAELEKRPGGE
jgi:hypothetical protein